MWKLYCSFLLSALLLGCYTTQKANRQLNKAQLNFPELVAKKSAEWFPCKTGKIFSDSSEYIRWIEQFNTIDTIYSFDTIISTKIDTIKLVKDCPKALIRYKQLIKQAPAIHDTFIINNDAQISSLNYQIDDYRKKYEKSQGHYIISVWFIVISLIILILSMLLKFFK